MEKEILKMEERTMVIENAIVEMDVDLLKDMGFNKRVIAWLKTQADPLQAWRRWMNNI